MEILAELAMADGGLKLSELTERLRLPKTSLHSLLGSFVDGGYIVMRDGRYSLGAETYKLASIIDRRKTFPDYLRPVLQKLCDETQETALIGILVADGHMVETVDVIESARPLRYTVHKGDRTPAHVSAMGHAFLAYLPAATLEAFFVDHDFGAYTAESFGRESFRRELAEVRRRGVARNVRGFDSELYGLAMPVFDAAGSPICAVCIGGPISRLESTEHANSERLRAAAEDMSRMSGMRGDYADALGADPDTRAAR
jgi:DNA-binding IclR family transcriptional regulator